MFDRSLISYLAIAEPVSSLSHLLGALLILGLAFRLFALVRGCRVRTAAVALFVCGTSGMFLASGTYHFLSRGQPLHRLFWYLDHAMIWVTIVGTIFAIQVLARVGCKRSMIGLWTLGIGGACLEGIFLDGLPGWVSPALFIGLGWFGVIPCARLVQRHGLGFVLPIVLAGAFTTLGGVTDALEWPMLLRGVVEGHEIMHLLIVAGMLCFAWAIDRCCRLPLPHLHPRPRQDRLEAAYEAAALQPA